MILCIVGPTAVGKTKLSVELAKKLNAIIVNADSTQIYKEFNIGTAKVTEEEKEGVPHYLFDIKNPNEDYTVYDYQKDARQIIEENKSRNIIFVGGTGLYLKAAFYNYEFKEEENNETFSNFSNAELYDLAKKKDPNVDIHPNNRKRLIRFLNKTNTQNAECYPLYNVKYIGLTTKRDILYDRINMRTQEMFKQGLVEEVTNLYAKYKDTKIFNAAIGYKEFIKYFNNELTLDETLDLISKNCRHYAKRQFTWFNNQMDIKWFDVDFDNFNNTINEVLKYIE